MIRQVEKSSWTEDMSGSSDSPGADASVFSGVSTIITRPSKNGVLSCASNAEEERPTQTGRPFFYVVVTKTATDSVNGKKELIAREKRFVAPFTGSKNSKA